MNAWKGKHASDLIASWGPPTATTTDGAGGQALIYYRKLDNLNCCYQAFYAGPNGVIYSWRRVDGWGAVHTPTAP
jgi:hypothetical protein